MRFYDSISKTFFLTEGSKSCHPQKFIPFKRLKIIKSKRFFVNLLSKTCLTILDSLIVFCMWYSFQESNFDLQIFPYFQVFVIFRSMGCTTLNFW